MTFQPAGPGKTAPKLYQDFLVFDPIKGRPNVLVDHSPPHGEGPQPSPPIGSCRHEYAAKFSQSVLPAPDAQPDNSAIYKIAVVCKKCRIHADLRLDHSNSTNPCPTSEHPLHHFQRVPSFDKTTEDRIRYVWQCSADECHANLFIHFRRPRLREGEIDHLTNPDQLKRRYEALLQEDPKRDGIRLATRLEALQRLRKYVKDSLNPEHNKRQFPSINKRFQEAFGIDGRDCHKLLERLGFKYADHTWSLPNPEHLHDRLQTDGNSLRELLEDVEIELIACMFKLSSEQGVKDPNDEAWTSANRDIERTLAAQGYARHVSTRRGPASNAELPFFNSLGALAEFSDPLVEYAYDRQTICDPERQPYYFECLQEITDSRSTEQLQMKVATLQSQEIVSRRDISAAYRYFSIPPSDGPNIEDSRIIELFQAQQPDLGATAQEEARGHLYKLGIVRGSNLLLNTSRQSVETYEDALSWLGNGVTKDTPDESILAVLALRTGDGAASEEIGQKAISVIARERKSALLNNWLLTGRTDGYTMSVDEALRHLNIDQPLEQIDKDIIQAVFSSARQDRPGETTNKAIAVIWKAVTSGDDNMGARSPENWPVGLTSHGNTCYLNSLLQYYFSIKPLRDIILNYDEYKLDTSAAPEKEARVGQRKVSLVEIKGGQRFAEDMKQLFQHMIKSPNLTVKPEEDLVCRAFLEPQQYRLLDPGLKDVKPGDRDQTMVNGIEGTEDNNLTDTPILASPTTETPAEEAQSSEASSVTLQASVNGEDTDVSMKNAEIPLTPPTSPGLKGGGNEISAHVPPPLPPRRRFSTAKEEALEIAKSKARQQQDVTEVHDGAMFRLRCGMMPRDRDSDGEQVDALRDLFSILMEETIVNKGVEQKPKVLADSSFQLNVPYENTDIYSALDAVFDLQPYGENSSMEIYKSIRALPPVLQINIPRIGYGENGAFKVNSTVRLEEELYLDRYYENIQPDILAKRRKCWGWRRRLQKLRLEQKVISNTPLDIDGPAAVAETASYLSSLDAVNRDLEDIGVGVIEADGELTEALSTEAEKQASAVASLETEIAALQRDVDAEFADNKTIKYRLAAVFFHRGQHGHGHYWIYIYDFAKKMWRAYNDERVEEFKRLNEIFEAKDFNEGTPTYAVYVDSNKLDMIQPVCRDPEAPPPGQTLPSIQFGGDVEMGEAKPQQDSVTTVDPKMVMEGGEESWDSPSVQNDRQGNDSFRAETRNLLGRNEPIRRISPGKRLGPETDDVGSPPKLRRMKGGESLHSKFTEVFYDSDEGSLPELDYGEESDEVSPLSDMPLDEQERLEALNALL